MIVGNRGTILTIRIAELVSADVTDGLGACGMFIVVV